MPRLEVRLFGSPDFRLDGQPIAGLAMRKTQALLVYLICNPRQIPRDLLAGMFWPEKSEADARNNLRRALPDLRKQLGAWLRTDRQTIEFVRVAPFWLDVDEFGAGQRRLREGATFADTDVDVAEAALNLYTGEFLAGFNLADAPAFDEWVFVQREHLRDLALRGLSTLTEHFLQTRQLRRGLAASQRLLALEPWQESGYQQRMVLLAWSGERAAALQQYALCAQMLADEFKLAPSAETTEIYMRVKAGEFDPVPAPVRSPQPASGATVPGLDDVPRLPLFVGRAGEVDQLESWRQAQSTVIAILGVGGAGKTALAAHYVRVYASAQAGVDRVLWTSLLNAPPLSSLLRIWLRAFSGENLTPLPDDVDEQMALLFPYLRRARCLLVLDNLETILEQGDARGRFRAGYRDYATLVRRMAEISHVSCLLLTSREMPAVLSDFQGRADGAVRVLPLSGLPLADGVALLAHAGLADAATAGEALVRHYSGNPLALRLAADTVRDLYLGDLSAFVAQGMPLFGTIRAVLDEQTARLSDSEREILLQLAVEREPVSINALWAALIEPLDRRAMLHALNMLFHTSLVERQANENGDATVRLTLQNVVMEYMTDRLLRAVCADLTDGTGQTLRRHPLVNVQAPEYVQAIQRRLLLQPVADWIIRQWGAATAARRLRQVLARLHADGTTATGYAAANILHLLIALEADLSGLDLAHMALRQADLRTAALGDVNLAGADLTGTVFRSTIGAIVSLAVAPDGRLLAGGGSNGNVYLWQIHDYQLVGVLRHHRQPIRALTFSGDGRRLVTAGLDGLICIWQVPAGTLASVIENPGRSLLTVAIHPDGVQVAASDTEAMIRIWAWPRAELRHAMRAPASIIKLAFSADGRTLLGVGDERTIALWDVASGALLEERRGHAGKILAVAWHPGGDVFATGGEDGQIILWDARAATPSRTLAGHADFVLSLAFDRTGTLLTSSSADQTVCIWDVNAGKPRRVLAGHRGWVASVVFADDSRTVFTSGYDQTVRAWDVQTGRLRHTIQGHLRWLDFVTFSPDGRSVAACNLSGPVQIWDMATRTMRHDLRGPTAATRGVAFDLTGARLATASDDHLVRIWDLRSGALLHTMKGHAGLVRDVVFSRDGKTLVSGGHDHTVRIWESATGQLRHTLHAANTLIRDAIAFRPGSNLLAYGTTDHTVAIADLATGEVVRTLAVDATTPTVVAFDPTGRYLACGTAEGAVWIFDMPAGRTAQQRRINAADKPVWRLLYSPDGACLAWVCAGQEIHLLNAASGQPCATMPTYMGAFCLAFTPDSQFLVTDGPDNTILVRDATTGAICQTLAGHTSGITSVDVSPAGDLIASSSTNGEIFLWDLQTGAWQATLTAEGPYAGMKIAGVTGITSAQRENLLLLGAQG